MKKKNYIVIGVVIFVVLVLSAVVLIKYKHSGGIAKDEDLRIYGNAPKEIGDVRNLSLVKITYDMNLPSGNINREYIFVLNDKNIVIDTIATERGYSKEELTRQYDAKQHESILWSSVKVIGDNFRYNTNYLNGKTLDEVKKILEKSPNYKYEEI